MLRKDKKKLESNWAFLSIESQKVQRQVKGLKNRARKVERAKNEVEEELACEKRIYDLASSVATSKLKKAEEKLVTMRSDLEQAGQQANAASGEAEATR